MKFIRDTRNCTPSKLKLFEDNKVLKRSAIRIKISRSSQNQDLKQMQKTLQNSHLRKILLNGARRQIDKNLPIILRLSLSFASSYFCNALASNISQVFLASYSSPLTRNPRLVNVTLQNSGTIFSNYVLLVGSSKSNCRYSNFRC